MAGIKRDSAAVADAAPVKHKKDKSEKKSSKSDTKHAVKPAKKSRNVTHALGESGTSDQQNGSNISANTDVEMSDSDSEQPKSKTQKRKAEDELAEKKKKSKYETPKEISSKLADMHGKHLPVLGLSHSTDPPLASNSREAHAKQKALAKERKNAKPNADVIERSKKLWEKLRLKSHVDKDERKELVKELFEIVTGRVKDFVFKHDSVRVIQTAIKYSTMEQRRMIARELKGEFKILSEGKYSKFLIAKLVEKG